MVSVTGSANDKSEFPFFQLLSDALPLSASLSAPCRVLRSVTEEGSSLGKCILQSGLLPYTHRVILTLSYYTCGITFTKLITSFVMVAKDTFEPS